MTLPALDFRNEALAPVLSERSLVISASAGSGKTFALVALVLGFLGRGGRAPRVVATTFGREAAADLRARLLQPLDQLAGWPPETWRQGLTALKEGFETWDRWCSSQEPALRPEIGAAARQWRQAEGWPDWMATPITARAHWIRTRREAELLQATTVHALAQALLRSRGLGGGDLLEADDPTLVRLLRAAGRAALDLPEVHPDAAAARRLWAWCEGFEQDRDRWHLLAASYDAHLDALGTWRASADAALPRERFLRVGRRLLEDYAGFVAEPLRAAALTKQGKAMANFTKIGLRNLEAEPVGEVDVPRLLDTLERLASRFLKDDGTPPNYYSEAFAAALAPLGESLPEHLEVWMTLLLERVFQAFRDLKAARGLRSYGDLVREAREQLQALPEAEPPALLLVDEYQDINPGQEAFLEALGAQRTVRVGDPKQAIYGFRGGVPELLRAKLRQAAQVGGAFRLPVNHRSSAPVVDLANAFVRTVMPNLDPASADPDGLQAHGGRGEGECRVTLTAVPSRRKGSDLQACGPWVAAHVEPLVQSREGFWDSPGVRLLLALLEASARPEAEGARFAVLRSPWVGASNAELLAYRLRGECGERFSEGLVWLEMLAQRSTQALVAEALVHPGLLECLSATAVHGALEPARARRNLEHFLGWIPGLPEAPALAWAQLEQLRNLRDPGDAPAEDATADLVVQTIHGSKGLEYDDVILPMLANSVKGVRKGTIRQRPSAPGRFWIGWKLGRARGPVLQELQREESVRVFREGLNLLYVGLTRAKGRLALLQQWPVSKEGAAEPPPSGAERLAESKSVQWHHVATDLAQAMPGLTCLESRPVPLELRVTGLRALQPPPTFRGVPPLRLPESARTGDGERVRKGILIHALLREVLVRDAVDPGAAQRYLAAHPLLLSWPGAAALVAAVLRGLTERGWARLPRRTEYELPGAGRSGGGGRADLVLWAPDRQNPACLHLLDFKLAASFTEETLDLHRLQLAAYRDALMAQYRRTAVDAWVVGLEGGGWVNVLP